MSCFFFVLKRIFVICRSCIFNLFSSEASRQPHQVKFQLNGRLYSKFTLILNFKVIITQINCQKFRIILDKYEKKLKLLLCTKKLIF